MCPKPPLDRVKPEVRALEGYHLAAHDCPVKLNQNECPFDVPEALKAEILEEVGKRPWSRYPRPMPSDLVQALSGHVGVDPDGLIVCNGSNTLIQLVLAVTTSPGVPVVVPSPSFSLYALYARVFGARVAPVALSESLAYDLPSLRNAIAAESAHTVMLCSPNNPTGGRVTNGELASVLESTDALVVVDEAYGEFSDSTALELLPSHPNLVVLKTFSKALGAAGIRIGYLIAHPALSQEFTKAKIPFDINVFSHVAALRLLEHPELIRERVAFILRERDRVMGDLGGLEGVRVYPSHANFMLFEVGDPGVVFDGLVSRGVLVRNVTEYPMLSGCLRVNVGTAAENNSFLQALEDTLQEAR